jgi:hypothetical protein
LFEDQNRAERRFPAVSLVRYEVVELPRILADPPSGFVRVAIGAGAMADTLRGALDDKIEKWKRSLERI